MNPNCIIFFIPKSNSRWDSRHYIHIWHSHLMGVTKGSSVSWREKVADAKEERETIFSKCPAVCKTFLYFSYRGHDMSCRTRMDFWLPQISKELNCPFCYVWTIVAMDCGGELGYWPWNTVLPDRIKVDLAIKVKNLLSSPLADQSSRLCHKRLSSFFQ